MKYYDIVGKRNWFFSLSLVIILAGLIFGVIYKPVLDIDFVGGTIVNINMKTNQFKEADVLKLVTDATKIEGLSIVRAGVNGDQVSIRTPRPLKSNEVKLAFDTVAAKYNLTADDLISSNTVEPLIGKELQRKGIIAVIISAILILVYVALTFSKMGGFAAGVTSIMALVHDIFILLAVYLIGRIPMNISFVAAALTILGYSMNDTIIVYDRIRENERLIKKMPVAELVNTSIIQTLGRTINTVLTVVITITTLYVFGIIYNVSAIKEFTLPLLIGIISGTYSSIFVASSLYVAWNESADKREKRLREKKA